MITCVDDFLCEIPGITSSIVFGYMGEHNQFPRYPSVLKLLKEEMKLYGLYWSKLSEKDRYEIDNICRDAFYGMKEAGF